MPHDVTLIATVAVAFVLAFIFGYFASRLHLPPLVGYLVAGVVIAMGANIGALSSSFTRSQFAGFAADTAMAGQLAEIGVMLLMFGVGLHFSVRDLVAVRRIAIPGAFLQIVIATGVGALLARFCGWTWGGGLVLGLCLSVASTVVLLKAMEARNAVASPNGRITVGWLVVEDLAMVLVLVLLPAFAGALGGHVPGGQGADHGGGSLGMALLDTFTKVTAFVLIVMFFGPRVMPWLLRQVARTGSRELFTLCVLAVAIGIAFVSAKLFDVSFALGAFFAGVVMSESELSHKAAENSLPLQDAFAVLFFVSVGMLFDPGILIQQPLMVLGVLAVIVIGKALISLGIVLAFGFPLSTALIAAASLAQVGEFSFILAGLGLSYGLLPPEGLSLILAGALLSIALNPFSFWIADQLNAKVRNSPELHRRFEENRSGPLVALQAELESVRLAQEARSLAHKRFTPKELVDRFPLFAELTPEQRELLLLHFENREATPGDRLIRAGEKADLAYFIAQGEVEVALKGGHKIKLQSGSFFGEMALLSGERRSAHVTALDYSKFLTLSARDFRLFLSKYPAVREKIAAQAAERIAMNAQATVVVPGEPAQEKAPG